MMKFFLFAVAIFPAITFASIDGKGLLCTCVEEHAVRVLPEPKNLEQYLESELSFLSGADAWHPLKCAETFAFISKKGTLTGNPDDADVFFTFFDGNVKEEYLAKENDDFFYHISKNFVYSTTLDYISWGDDFELYRVGRKSLQLVRQIPYGNIREVSQCKLFSSIEELEAAKSEYKKQFEQKFKQQMEARGNQL